MLELLKFLGGFYPQEETYFPFQKELKQFFGFTPFDTHAHFYMVCDIKKHLNPNPATQKLNKVVLFRLYQPSLALLLLWFCRQHIMQQTPVTENFPLIHLLRLCSVSQHLLNYQMHFHLFTCQLHADTKTELQVRTKEKERDQTDTPLT